MGPGLSVMNCTNHELLVVLRQAGPLHWERIYPGEKKKINCGKVWFNVHATVWVDETPTSWEVARPFVYGAAGVAAIGVMLVELVLLKDGSFAKRFFDLAQGVATKASGAFTDLNSRSERVIVTPVSHGGVYADGRTVTVTCKKMGDGRERLVLSGC